MSHSSAKKIRALMAAPSKRRLLAISMVNRGEIAMAVGGVTAAAVLIAFSLV
jgi:hypothetical protein